MKKHKRHHLLPFITFFLVIVFIALVIESNIEISHTLVSIVAIVYLVSNLAYGYVNKELTMGRILEFGAVALLIELVAFRFLT